MKDRIWRLAVSSNTSSEGPAVVAEDAPRQTRRRFWSRGAPRPPVAPRSLRRRVVEWVAIFAVAILAAVLLRSFVVETFFIPSGSMIPTLDIGDRILVDKLPFATDHIARGQIIVFRRVPADTDPTHPADLVKRVIGLPGETIWSVGDQIYINGRRLAEPWLPNLNSDPPSALCAERDYGIARTTIAKGHYFVMGDCRGNSLDSRSWGTVPQSYIVGEVFVVLWRSGHPWFHWL